MTQTEGIISDIHGLFRYSIPGYIFLFILLLFFAEEIFPFFLDPRNNIIGLVAASIIICFVLGFIFSNIYQAFFNLFLRKKHFRDIIEDIKETLGYKKSDPCWFLISKNDTIIYRKMGDKNEITNDDYSIERSRITHLTSKFYMFGAIIVSQLLLLSGFIFSHLLNIGFLSFKTISIILSIFFLVYSFFEERFNRNLVKEFNKNLVDKIFKKLSPKEKKILRKKYNPSPHHTHMPE